jgi:hypothetical protein
MSPDQSPASPSEHNPIDPAERMRQALVAATNGTGARDAFQSAASELVTAWRREGVPPEQIILRVKDILADAGLRASYGPPMAPAPSDAGESEVYRRVIAWTIRFYFEGEATT